MPDMDCDHLTHHHGIEDVDRRLNSLRVMEIFKWRAFPNTLAPIAFAFIASGGRSPEVLERILTQLVFRSQLCSRGSDAANDEVVASSA
ncbi:hypothetical protein ACSSVY_003476 [Roseovarius sp. MBR-51]